MKCIALFLIAVMALSVACNRKMSNKEVKDHLEKAMSDHLNNHHPANTPHPKFDVLDVAWFEEPQFYTCEFKIKMTLPTGQDTTGYMKQKISKDFAKVQ